MLVLVSALALADVVGDPATDCPPGAVGRASHAGPYCAPAGCDDACDGECRAAGLCVIEHTVTRTYTGPFTWEEAVSACDGPADCTGDAICAVEDRCLPVPGDSSLLVGGADCGCRSGTGVPAAMLGIGLAVWALALRRTRR